MKGGIDSRHDRCVQNEVDGRGRRAMKTWINHLRYDGRRRGICLKARKHIFSSGQRSQFYGVNAGEKFT